MLESGGCEMPPKPKPEPNVLGIRSPKKTAKQRTKTYNHEKFKRRITQSEDGYQQSEEKNAGCSQVAIHIKQ